MKLKIGLNAWTLFIVFLILKLTGVIAWSWWWVAAPLWIPFVLVGTLAALATVLFVIVALVALVVAADTSQDRHKAGGW